ncbi:MAG TPA: ATP-binding protein [Azospirillum sp.]
MGLDRHLLLLVLATLLPMLALGAALAYWSAATQRETTERGLQEWARTMMVALDQELRISTTSLQVLALSTLLDADDLAAFHTEAWTARRFHPSWHTVALLEPGGRQVLNLLRPFSAELLPATDAEPIRRMGEQPVPIVSDLFHGRIAGRTLFSIDVPVTRDGRLHYILSAAIAPESLTALIHQPGLPDGWVGVVTDGQQRIIARSEGHERFLGRGASQRYARIVAGATEGIFRGVALDGRAVVVAFKRSSVANWTFSVMAPVEIVDAPLHRTMFGMAVGGGGLLLASVASAYLVGRRIALHVRALAEASGALAVGQPIAVHAPTPIREINVLWQTLATASHKLLASTDRRERALIDKAQRAEDRFSRVANLIPAFLCSCAPDGRTTLRNSWWSDYAGLPSGEMNGETPADAVHDDDRAAFLKAWRTALTAGTPFHHEMRLRHREGTYRWHLAHAEPIRDEGGAITEWIGLAIDIDDRKQIEAALRDYGSLQDRARQDAQQANNAKSHFMAAASHDLRQPFQAMRLFHHILDTTTTDTRQRKAVDNLGAALRSAEDLLNGLMDVSALEAGRITPTTRSVPLAEIMDARASEFAGMAQQKGLRVTVVHCGLTASSDPMLLKRMVGNLVANAVRYTERGRILVGCRRRGSAVHIQVWDTGIGIPAEKLDAIFEDFYQVGNGEKDRTKGLGLGLSIVLRMAKLMGHEVTVRSTPGRGSVFTIIVPRHAPDETAPGLGTPV